MKNYNEIILITGTWLTGHYSTSSFLLADDSPYQTNRSNFRECAFVAYTKQLRHPPLLAPTSKNLWLPMQTLESSIHLIYMYRLPSWNKSGISRLIQVFFHLTGLRFSSKIITGDFNASKICQSFIPAPPAILEFVLEMHADPGSRRMTTSTRLHNNLNIATPTLLKNFFQSSVCPSPCTKLFPLSFLLHRNESPKGMKCQFLVHHF